MNIKFIQYIFAIFGIVSCNHDDDLISDYIPFTVPEGFPEATYTFLGDNVKNEEVVFELGRKLFYESKLSSDNSVSCAECHNQSFVFTHHGHDLSTGVADALGTRNTQALQNLAFQKSFNWNGGETQLWRQPIIPITAEVEMNETFSNIVSKLSLESEYVSMFGKAYYDGEINLTNILKSLGNFLGMMISSNSKYDQYLAGEVDFTEDELSGLNLFNQKCISCHSGILFTDESFRNNGLKLNDDIPDELGRQAISEDEDDFYKFKVPSLRNVEKSGPYMHDGRISSLRGVLNFYDNNVSETTTLDPLLNNNGVLGIPLEETEKDQLIAFLETLTDDEFLNDERFAEPN